jgi:S1-C subfamily serine protease
MRKPLRICLLALLILTGLVLVPHLRDSRAGAAPAYLGIAVDMLAAQEDGRIVGLRISQVVDGSPAARAGIEVHDVLLTLDGQTPDSEARLSALLRAAQPGQTLTLELLRGGSVLERRAKLASRP